MVEKIRTVPIRPPGLVCGGKGELGAAVPAMEKDIRDAAQCNALCLLEMVYEGVPAACLSDRGNTRRPADG